MCDLLLCITYFIEIEKKYVIPSIRGIVLIKVYTKKKCKKMTYFSLAT